MHRPASYAVSISGDKVLVRLQGCKLPSCPIPTDEAIVMAWRFRHSHPDLSRAIRRAVALVRLDTVIDLVWAEPHEDMAAWFKAKVTRAVAQNAG
jgi:hypothetical protein